MIGFEQVLEPPRSPVRGGLYIVNIHAGKRDLSGGEVGEWIEEVKFRKLEHGVMILGWQFEKICAWRVKSSILIVGTKEAA